MKPNPISIILLLLVGCATPYQSEHFNGGFSDTRLAPDVFSIHFSGNAATRPQRVQDFVMLRAAELCVAHEFVCFTILNHQNTTDVSSYTTSGYSQTTVYGTYYGSHAVVTGHTTEIPPETDYISKPRSELLIKCFSDKPKAPYTFDAAFLLDSLRQKYHLVPAVKPSK
jgi:hypothetical protein